MVFSLCACGALTRALHVGLDKLMSMIFDDPVMSNYYTHGYKSINGDMRKFIALACVNGWLAESVMQELMEDGRVARNLDKLERTIQEEHQFIQDLSGTSWTRLAAVVKVPEYSALDLQQDALQSIHVQRAFMDM
eukprot:5141477-Lingulodinium_polyedra.AAC.1